MRSNKSHECTPGTSGVLSPFTKLKSLYFDEANEPDDFRFDFMKTIKETLQSEDVEYIGISCDNKVDFYNIMDKLSTFTNTNVKAYGTSRDQYNIIVDNKTIDTSDEEDPTDDDDDIA